MDMNTLPPVTEADQTRTLNSPKRQRRSRTAPLRSPKISEALRRKWQEPDYRAKMTAWAEERRADPTKAWSRRGIFKGMSREESARVRAEAEASAKETMKALRAAGMVSMETTDDQKAAEALEACLALMRLPVNARLRLQAARVLLTFTKGAPPRRSSVTTDSTEAWLSAVAAAAAA